MSSFPEQTVALKRERFEHLKSYILKSEKQIADLAEIDKAAALELVERFELPHPLAKKYVLALRERQLEVSDELTQKFCAHDDKHGLMFMVLAKHAEDIVKGKKLMSRRFRRWVDAGDTFSVKGQIFRVTRVDKMRVGDITDEDILKEGYTSRQDFEAMWYKSHPKSVAAGKTLDPNQKCWCHEYEPL